MNIVSSTVGVAFESFQRHDNISTYLLLRRRRRVIFVLTESSLENKLTFATSTRFNNGKRHNMLTRTYEY